MRMETRAAYVAVGTFVLVLLAGLVLAGLWFARVAVSEKGIDYDIYFTGSVAGLNIGSAVRMNGVPIGRVAAIKLDPENPGQVRVTATIDRDVAIKSDAVASLELQGLTGAEQIEITGGSRTAPSLVAHPGEPHPVIASSPSGLQQVVTSAPELLARANGLMEELSDLLKPQNRTAVAQTLVNLQTITGVAAAHSGQIASSISDGAAAARSLRETLQRTDAVVAELERLAAPGGALPAAVRNLDQSTRALAEVGGHLDALVQENRPGLRNFTQRGLPELQQVLVQAQGLIGDLDQLVQALQRDPALLLYGDRHQGYRPP